MKTDLNIPALAAKAIQLFKEGKLTPKTGTTLHKVDNKLECCPLGALYYAYHDSVTEDSDVLMLNEVIDFFKMELNCGPIVGKFDSSFNAAETFEEILTEIQMGGHKSLFTVS